MDEPIPVSLGSETLAQSKQSSSGFLYPSGFSDLLFQEVLQHGNASSKRVMAVVKLASRHPLAAQAVYEALRHSLASASSVIKQWPLPELVSGTLIKNEIREDPQLSAAIQHLRFLWYVLDGLMKHASHVFLPLVIPPLQEHVSHCIPWSHLYPCDVQWCREMIASWGKWVPHDLYNNIQKKLAQQVLDVEILSAGGKEVSPILDSSDQNLAASADDVVQLQENMDALYFALQAVIEEKERSDLQKQLSNTAALLSLENSSVGTHLLALSNNSQTADGEESDSDSSNSEEYVPELIDGAELRELPKLDVPRVRARRAIRRRQREDDM